MLTCVLEAVKVYAIPQRLGVVEDALVVGLGVLLPQPASSAARPEADARASAEQLRSVALPTILLIAWTERRLSA